METRANYVAVGAFVLIVLARYFCRDFMVGTRCSSQPSTNITKLMCWGR